MNILVYNGKGLSQIKHYKKNKVIEGFRGEQYGLINLSDRFDIIFNMFASDEVDVELGLNTVYRFTKKPCI